MPRAFIVLEYGNDNLIEPFDLDRFIEPITQKPQKLCHINYLILDTPTML